jgi:hypothetical protein
MTGYTTIQIYCQDACHADTRWLVDEFARTGRLYDGGPGEWVPLEMLGASERNLWRPPDARGVLDSATDADLGDPFTGPVVVRDRYKLVCRRCKRHGRRVRPVEARDEQLGRIFDTLADNGWTSISLAALGGRISGSVTR